MNAAQTTAQLSMDRLSPENKGRTNSAEFEEDLVSIPFFQGMSASHIGILGGCARRAHFKETETIFRQRETADRFYLIEDGMVELEAASEWGGRRIVAGGIGPGGVLGWSWLFPPYKWQFTARVLTDATAIVFDAPLLRQHCEADASLGFELFKRMAAEMVKRLQSARRDLLDCASGFSSIGAEHAFSV